MKSSLPCGFEFIFIEMVSYLLLASRMLKTKNVGTLCHAREYKSCKPLAPGLMPSCIKLALGILGGLSLFASTASAQQAYAVEFNQVNNRFGSFNLADGSFTQLGSEGGTLFNDVAAAPNGTLYGIVNSASLVTLNLANGATLSSVPFSVGGIESLAISPRGIVYGATQGALYTINPANGQAALVGNFNNSLIGNSGQNIRFAGDGNLYNTDGGTDANNTDLFQIDLATGAATTRGVVHNIPGLCLENSGKIMYGVGIQIGAASTLALDLVGLDINALPSDGLNSDGSMASVNYTVVNSAFPNNFNFSASDDYTVAGTPIIPEPGVTGLLLMGGAILTVSLKRRNRLG